MLVVAGAVVAVAVFAGSSLSQTSSHSPISYSVGHVSDVSVGCPGTGDSWEAVYPARHEVFQAFEGCGGDNGIGFALSKNGGESYTRPIALPGSNGGWDPALAVAPDGTLYAAFMNTIGTRTYPIVDVSRDGGRRFRVEHSLRPMQPNNWGDADYLAVSSDGALYVAWDYGPSNAEVKSSCSPAGSCWATNGDLNVVVQRSTDDASHFSPMSVATPRFPDGGADEGDVAVAPDGTVDILYQDYRVMNRRSLRLADGSEYFTASSNGGTTWSRPVEVGASAGTITIDEWWNDGSVATDAAGTLYATWDTQGRAGRRRTDVGWLSYSSDGGQNWSRPIQAIPDRKNVPHILEVVGARPREAYVAWMSASNRHGYALYLRAFAAGRHGRDGRWLSPAIRVSPFASAKGYPGDTFGLDTSSPDHLVVSWGAAAAGADGISSLYATGVRIRGG